MDNGTLQLLRGGCIQDGFIGIFAGVGMVSGVGDAWGDVLREPRYIPTWTSDLRDNWLLWVL